MMGISTCRKCGGRLFPCPGVEGPICYCKDEPFWMVVLSWIKEKIKV